MDWGKLLTAFIFWDAWNGDRARNDLKKQEIEYARQHNLPEPVFEPTPYSIGGSRVLLYAFVYFGILFGGIAFIILLMNIGDFTN